jgi:hypothetical protein
MGCDFLTKYIMNKTYFLSFGIRRLRRWRIQALNYGTRENNEVEMV